MVTGDARVRADPSWTADSALGSAANLWAPVDAVEAVMAGAEEFLGGNGTWEMRLGGPLAGSYTVQGSMVSRPAALNGAVSRVATVMPLAAAVAAM